MRPISDCVDYATNPNGDCGGRTLVKGGRVYCENCWDKRERKLRPFRFTVTVTTN